MYTPLEPLAWSEWNELPSISGMAYPPDDEDDGVGVGVGLGVGFGVGVLSGVGEGVGDGVGVADGLGVGVGVDVASGDGVGAGSDSSDGKTGISEELADCPFSDSSMSPLP